MTKQQKYLDFDQYIQQGEPEQKDKAEAWRVAIGLQAVDGLKTSEMIPFALKSNVPVDKILVMFTETLSASSLSASAQSRAVLVV